MTTEHTAIGPDEPDFDWDLLNRQVFGGEDTTAPAAPTPTAPAVVPQAPVPAVPVAAVPAVLDAPVPAAPAAAAEDSEDAAMLPLSTGLKWVIGGVVLAVFVLAVLGFVVSFDTQTREVEPYFGVYAPLVPLAIDLGIVVFAALNLVLARLNMSIMWLRAVPWVLTAMTLYINLSAHHELVARVAHVALPGMWIVASEVGTHVLRIRAGLEAGTRTESLGLVRWVLDPVSTFRLWRYMRLWGLRTAEAARASESQRLMARAALHARYGVLWRVRTPIQLRTAYRLRTLEAAEVYTWRPPVIVGDVPEVPTGDGAEDTIGDATAAREDVPGDTAASVLKDANEDANEDAAKDTTGDTRKDAREDTAEDATKDGHEDAMKDVPGDAREDAKPRPRRARKDSGKRRVAAAKGASDAQLVVKLREVEATEGRPSVRQVVAALGVGKDRAQRLLAQLDAEPA